MISFIPLGISARGLMLSVVKTFFRNVVVGVDILSFFSCSFNFSMLSWYVAKRSCVALEVTFWFNSVCSTVLSVEYICWLCSVAVICLCEMLIIFCWFNSSRDANSWFVS